MEFRDGISNLLTIIGHIIMIAALSLSFLAVVNTKQSHLSILRFAAAVATAAAAPRRQQERHDWLAKSRRRTEMPATGYAPAAAAVAMSAGWAEQVEPAETAVLFNL